MTNHLFEALGSVSKARKWDRTMCAAIYAKMFYRPRMDMISYQAVNDF